MSKKTTETKQPPFVEELLKNGTTVLTAKTRDELAEIVNDIPADVHYAVGAVGYNPDAGVFTLRVDISNN
jgi:hypothetical protein